jgi:electron transport complex protein RnfG
VREPGSTRLILTLGLTGLASGIVLVGVYLLTFERIQRNQAEALRAAIYRVLPGTSTIETFVVRGSALATYDGPADSIPSEQAVYAGHDESGTLVGYAVPADGPGFMDTIKLIYGFDPARRVVIGMQVLDSRETPGLGDKIITDPAFHENFRALEVDPEIVAVKKGKKTEANQVDCITGATISSEAVVGILNESTRQWAPLLTPPSRTAAITAEPAEAIDDATRAAR